MSTHAASCPRIFRVKSGARILAILILIASASPTIWANQAPTVAQAASASPNPVTGTTTNVSVLGADADGTGEAGLTYSWDAPGTPNPDPTFTPNGTNAAKNSVVTFGKAGVYTLRCTIKDSGNLTVTSTVSVTVVTTFTSVSLTPSHPTINTGATQQFNAKAKDQFDKNLSPQPSFTWAVSGGGTINSSGLFTSNGTAGTFTVTATSGTKSATAQITVVSTNAAPTIATPASATPNPVDGTTTNLSVLGADDGGEAALAYSWASTGPATVNFSANGTNAAKNATATFTKTGSYSLTATATDAGNLSVSSSVNVVVNQTLTTITVTPANGASALNGAVQYAASAKDQFGSALSPQPTITWSVSGGGSIDANGLFTAGGSAGGPFVVTASSGAVSGTANITVSDSAPFVVNPASISPDPVTGTSATVTVLGGDDGLESHLKYFWSTTGSPPAGVTFSDNNTNSAKNTTANFSKAGGYTLLVTITDQSGQSATSTVSFNVEQTLTSITVSGDSPATTVNGQIHFAATARDQFGDALATQPSFAWSVDGGGSIDSSGVFTAGPTAGGPFSATATASSVFGSASFSVTDEPPYIITAASATPNPVTGTTTALSVRAGDDSIESTLQYTWSVVGTAPGSVAFSPNGDNSAKDCTATFQIAGLYHLQVTVTDPANLTATSAVDVQVNSVLNDVLVTPKNAATVQNGSLDFSAKGLDQFGYELASQPSFNWNVDGGGTIDQNGHFTAVQTLGTFTVTATSGAFFDTASVTVSNDAPFIRNAASANPNPVTGTTTSLSVLGGDDAAESGLSYAWQVLSGPASVIFSSNGTNASKNTTATFSLAGNYSFRVTATDAQGLNATSSVNVVVNQVAQSVAVSPASATVTTGGTQQFSANTPDQFGQQISTVSWSVNGGGTINQSGLFSAGQTSGGPFTVSASRDGKTGTASLTVAASNTPPAANAQNVSTNEDTAKAITLTATDPDPDTLTYTVVQSPQHGSLTGTAPNLTYSPAQDYFGADSFTFKANDGHVDSNVATISITVNPVNDVPSFVVGSNQVVAKNAAAQSITNWATNISAGPANESGQQLNFILTLHGDNLFSTTTPSISSSGTLTYTPAANVTGSALLSVQLHDNGGTANGGVDTSPAQYAIITVTDQATTSGPVITTYAGNGVGGYNGDNRLATTAQLAFPYGVAVTATVDNTGNVYIADLYNHRIRKVNGTTGIITTVAGTGTAGFSGDGGLATSANLNFPTAAAVDSSGNLYIADQGNHRIRKVNASNGVISTIAGNGTAGYSGNGGAATSAQLNNPESVAVDASGSNVYIGDTLNHAVRRVSSGIIQTVAGSGISGYFGDGGPATSARLFNPYSVALDGQNNLYIADSGNNVIRKVSSGIIQTVAITGDSDPFSFSTFNRPYGVAVSSTGEIYVADTYNNRIRLIDTTGFVSTIAGNGAGSYSGDGGLAINASMYQPTGICLGLVLLIWPLGAVTVGAVVGAMLGVVAVAWLL